MPDRAEGVPPPFLFFKMGELPKAEGVEMGELSRNTRRLGGRKGSPPPFLYLKMGEVPARAVGACINGEFHRVNTGRIFAQAVVQ